MPSRAELVARAAVLGLDPTTLMNDSKLEQKVLFLEKNATAFAGTIGTTTLTSDGTNVSNADTITLGGTTYTFKTALTEAAANSTLTTTGTFSDGELLTIDGWVYVMRTALSTNIQVRNEILIGAAATNSLDNIKTTINGTGQGTTTNISTYAHPTVTAGTKTASTLVVSAKNVGTYGNAFITATTAANATWTGTTLSGGALPVANEILIGASVAAMLTNVYNAINDAGVSGVNYSSTTSAHKEAIATTSSPTTTQVINGRNFSDTNGSLATTKSAAHLSFTGATMASGVAKVIAAATSNDQISGAVDHI